jgi:tRNA nucleotidyltransferase (CCA-adding enzyme)
MSAAWEHFSHGADIGVRGRGPTLEAAFAGAGLALIAVITDPAAVAAREAVALRCEAPDRELLLVAWLNEIVFAIASRRMLFGRFEVAVDGNLLRATGWGEPIDVARHRPAVEVKGATMTALRVARGDDGTWTAETVVDV